MAHLAIRRELGRGMRRIGGRVVVVQVTADTGIRCGVIVPVMALVAIRDGGVCSRQCPVIIVVRK